MKTHVSLHTLQSNEVAAAKDIVFAFCQFKKSHCHYTTHARENGLPNSGVIKERSCGDAKQMSTDRT
jgi:hypothetical protein